jgi:hypothetical protein
MALPKRVKVGGSYYKGHLLPVSSSTGNYPLAIVPSTTGHAVNGVSITPELYGTGDYFGLYHYSTTATSGGTLIKTLAESIYNVGGGVSIMLDFATLELVNPGESLRFVYTNAATTAMNVYVTVEVVR